MTDEPTTKARRAGKGWSIGCLAGVVMLALLTAAFVPHFRSVSRMLREFDELRTEAHRLGGRAGIDNSEGGLDFSYDPVTVTVDLRDTPFDDEQLARLLRIPAFRYVINLSVAGTHVTDRGLEMLVDRPPICLLDVSRTRITDHGLASIAKMRNVISLNLSGNPITDRGIETLIAQMGSSHLDAVVLYDTQVSKAEAQRLRNAMIHGSILGPARPTQR